MRAWAAFGVRRLLVCVFRRCVWLCRAKRALRRCCIGTQFGDAFGLVVDLADRARLSVWAVEFSRPSLPSAACFCALRVLRRATSALMALSCAPEFGLLLHKPSNHAFVGLVDVAGVLDRCALFGRARRFSETTSRRWAGGFYNGRSKGAPLALWYRPLRFSDGLIRFGRVCSFCQASRCCRLTSLKACCALASAARVCARVCSALFWAACLACKSAWGGADGLADIAQIAGIDGRSRFGAAKRGAERPSRAASSKGLNDMVCFNRVGRKRGDYTGLPGRLKRAAHIGAMFQTALQKQQASPISRETL